MKAGTNLTILFGSQVTGNESLGFGTNECWNESCKEIKLPLSRRSEHLSKEPEGKAHYDAWNQRTFCYGIGVPKHNKRWPFEHQCYD